MNNLKVISNTEFGHWEIDTIVGTVDTSAVLLMLDERKTRKRIIRKIKSRHFKEVNKTLERIMREYGKFAPKIFKSITADNGSEFAHLSEAVPFAKIYYAHPYSSCERRAQRKVLIRSTDSDKAEVDIDYILKLDSSDIHKRVQEYIDKINKPVSESPKKETTVREMLLKFVVPKDVIIDDGENFLSQEEFQKARFVEKELFFLLRAANSKISDTTYCKENGNETVIVTMENGCKYKIDITCDSLLAIANDVCRFMAHK